MVKIAEKLKVKNKWEFELAGMLSQTGCITLPTILLNKINKGQVLTGLETGMYEAHPNIGYDILVNIPRLESIANMILYQGKHYDGTGFPEGALKGTDLPLESRALHIIVDFDTLVRSGDTKQRALKALKSHTQWYDPTLVKVLDEIVRGETKTSLKTIRVKDLITGAVLAEDIKTSGGTLLVAKGQPVSKALKERLINFYRSGEGPDKVNILITDDDFR
jgi:response regulator RpfG family c-di-GMP phosphodiesterase